MVSWDQYLQAQSVVRPIIHLYHGNKTYAMTNYSFSGEGESAVIMGTLSEVPAYAIPEQPSFLRNKLPDNVKPIINEIMHLYTDIEPQEGEMTLALKDIQQVIYHQNNTAANVLVNTGVGIVSAVAGFAIFLAIACNCPRVYAMGPEGPVMQGSLFTGAISKSLERTDYLPLQGLDRRGKQLEITVANELPEKEYLDHLQLLKVRPTPGASLGMDASSGQLFEYQSLQPAIAASSVDGRDLLARVKAQDEQVYNFDDQAYAEDLNSAVFTFDKSALQQDQAQLVVQVRQTEWLETVAEYFFQQFGNEFDRWVEMMDKVPADKYNERVAERGMSMNAYLKTAEGWKPVGTFHNAGVVQQKTMGLHLDLSQIAGDEVQIKLTSAHRFWELDQIGLSEDARSLTGYETVPLLGATNEQGEDIGALIQAQDQNYQILPDQQSAINLVFANTAAEDEIYVLQGTGYYHHLRDYTHEPNKPLLKAMKKGELTTHQLSQMLDRAQELSVLSQTAR